MAGMHPRVLFLFVDGVGLGSSSPSNPLAALDLPSFKEMAAGQPWTIDASDIRRPDHVFLAADANLGVEGLPQSGTGQASLFTGVNCAKLAERHFGPFPHSSSRPVIARDNIFSVIARETPTAIDQLAFANAYPERFFSYVRTTDRWTVTTLCCVSAGVRLHSEKDLVAGRAIAANITGEGWPGEALPRVGEDEAAQRLLDISCRHRLTLFEYYLTDKAGHGRPGADATTVLSSLDRFFGSLLDGKPDDLLIVLTSDHGNIENLSTRSHTRNPVPLIAIGPGADAFSEASSILDVTPIIVRSLADG